MMRIASCSYEGSIFGWDVKVDESKEGLVLPMSFGFNCSQGSLKTLAVSSGGKFLCCGGTDERIRIFNVAENRSMGELGLHEGAITCLEFFEDSYMISGSEDKMLRIWRCHDWECVHVLSGHKEPITSVSIHPSGKLALSVSKDNTMKLWNLVQGRCSFTRRLRGAADRVMWHPSGDYYMLIVQMEVQIFRASDNVCVASIKHKSRVNQAVFTMCGCSSGDSSSLSLSSSSMRVACVCEDKTLNFYNLEGERTAVLDVNGLDGRPRDMWSCKLDLTDVTSGENDDTGSISSVLAEEGDCLAVITSLGRVSVISSRSIEAGNTLEESTLVSTQVKMEPRLTGVVAWSRASTPVSTETASGIEKISVDRKPKKRPRDSSSAAADIAAEKVTEIANTAASSSRKKIALSRAKVSGEEVKRSEKGKKKRHEENNGRGKNEGNGNSKDRGLGSTTPTTKQVSFSPSNSASKEGKEKDVTKKTKNNVYYKKR